MLDFMAGDELIVVAALKLMLLNDRSDMDRLTAEQWCRAQELLKPALRPKTLPLDRPTEPSPPPKMEQ